MASPLATCRDALVRHRIDRPALHDSVRSLQAVRSEVLARPVFMHLDDIHGGNMLVDGGKFQGFIDFEASRPGNELYLLGVALQWARLADPAQWPPIRAISEEEQGASLSAYMLALVELFARFQNWCRFAWYWGSDEQPDWVWRGNERDNVLSQLVHTLDVAHSVVEERP